MPDSTTADVRGIMDDLIDDVYRDLENHPAEHPNSLPALPDDDEEGWSLDALWIAQAHLERKVAAAKAVLDHINAEFAHRLGEGGCVRMGEDFIRYSKANDYVSTDTLDEWLLTLPASDVLAILPSRKFKITGLRAVAVKHGMSADALEGTFYINRRDDKEPGLTKMPVGLDKTPKYAQGMSHGEIRRGRKRA